MLSLESVSQNIWTIPAPLSLAGIALNTRTTIVRLDNGQLWVHSPIKIDDDIKSAVSELGVVRWLIAPNVLHHLFIGDWKEAFPDAEILAPKGLNKKRPDLDISNTIIDGACWGDEISVLFLKGISAVQEHLFYHHASQTIIITDLCFYNPEAKGFTGFYFWLNQVKNRIGVPLLVRYYIKDKSALANALAPTRDWSVQNISMCHNAILSDNAHSEWNRILDQLGA